MGLLLVLPIAASQAIEMQHHPQRQLQFAASFDPLFLLAARLLGSKDFVCLEMER
jgi:hypothetical protein